MKRTILSKDRKTGLGYLGILYCVYYLDYISRKVLEVVEK